MATPRSDAPSTRRCPYCGQPAPVPAAVCAACRRPLGDAVTPIDPRARGWRPDVVPGPDLGAPAVPPLRRAGRVVVEGQIRGLQQRSEGGDARVEVWSFRLERFDSAGNRSMVLPVDVRGILIEGALADGDWVRVSGAFRAGTLRAREVADLSTGATIAPASGPRWFGIVVLVLMLLMLVFAIVMVVVTMRAFPDVHMVVAMAATAPWALPRPGRKGWR